MRESVLNTQSHVSPAEIPCVQRTPNAARPTTNHYVRRTAERAQSARERSVSRRQRSVSSADSSSVALTLSPVTTTTRRSVTHTRNSVSCVMVGSARVPGWSFKIVTRHAVSTTPLAVRTAPSALHPSIPKNVIRAGNRSVVMTVSSARRVMRRSARHTSETVASAVSRYVWNTLNGVGFTDCHNVVAMSIIVKSTHPSV